MHQRLDLELSADASEAKRLRNELQRWLGSAGINGRTAQDVALAVTEAFNDAIEHPRERRTPTIRISGEVAADEIVLHVSTAEDRQPHPERGRQRYGRELMTALMNRIAVDRTPEHITVTLRRSLERVPPTQPE
jgi:anti-sigma regulatory factor (Ser/Thr protein kinase)